MTFVCRFSNDGTNYSKRKINGAMNSTTIDKIIITPVSIVEDP